jgi:DNA-binding transcriptional LysR family regulator
MQLQAESVLRVGMFSSCEASADFDRARELIAAYREKYPEVQVYVEYMTLSDLRHHVLSGNLDVAVSMSYALKNMLDVEKRRINKTTWGIAIPETFAAARNDVLDMKELDSVTLFCLSPEESQVDKPLNLERCLQVGFTPKNIVYMQNAMSIFSAVEHGQGCYLVGDLCRRVPGVRHYSLPELPNTPYVTAVWRAQNSHAELRRFIDMLPPPETNA